MTTPGLAVRVTREDDWRRLRDLRLRALADSPAAFAQTLDGALALGEDEWRQRARGSAASVSLLATAGGSAVGMLALMGADTTAGLLVGMWVDPDIRGTGVGARLLEEAQRIAGARGLNAVRLWVADGNAGARRLYERAGFTDTGATEVMPSYPDRAIREMALRL